jgi:hypothetical protein
MSLIGRLKRLSARWLRREVLLMKVTKAIEKDLPFDGAAATRSQSHRIVL